MPYYILLKRSDGSWDLCEDGKVVIEHIDYEYGVQKLHESCWGPQSRYEPVTYAYISPETAPGAEWAIGNAI
jgi:hypothetical protein